MLKNKAIVAILLVFFLGIATGLVTARFLMHVIPRLLCGDSCQNAVTSDRLYYSDDVILSGTTSSGEPLLLYLSLNRKKVGKEFSHYYFGDVLYKGTRKKLYTSFMSQSSDVSPSGFLKNYTNTKAEDVSARESVDLEFIFNDLHVSSHAEGFQGDFIVKNSLEYTKYASVSDSAVELNGQKIPANIYFEKVYSSDYSKYVFFDGYDSLRSLAQFFVLWDESGNFYLLDASTVDSKQENYKSHTWALTKSKTSQSMKKSFFATVQAEAPNFKPRSWNIQIPDFQTSFVLSPAIAFSSEAVEGLAEGTVTTPAGSSKVRGYFSFHKYGE